MEQAYAQMRRKLRMTRLAEDMSKIMVLSGRSREIHRSDRFGTESCTQGKKVGILDIDIGPKHSQDAGHRGTELHVEDSRILLMGPLESDVHGFPVRRSR